VTLFSIVIASVRAGSVVAPYPEGRKKNEHFSSYINTPRGLTKPLSRCDTQVLIPFTILDAILMDETTLKRNQLLINLAHDLQRLDELGRRTMRMLGSMRQREPRPVLSHDVNLVVISESEIRRTA
jgi:hypothetical protein